jgi:hypothetical protein
LPSRQRLHHLSREQEQSGLAVRFERGKAISIVRFKAGTLRFNLMKEELFDFMQDV